MANAEERRQVIVAERSGPLRFLARHPVLSVALLACCVGVWFYSQRGWTVAKLERLIQTELPLDCDRKTAEAWFKRHGIWHDSFAYAPRDMRGHSTMQQLAGLQSKYIEHTVRGEIDSPAANVGLIDSGRISLYFFFDENDRLLGHYIDEFMYSF